MYNFNCIIRAVISFIIGIIIGALFYFAFIPSIIIAIWIAFGISILSLILLTIISIFGKERTEKCICKNGKCLTISIIGTITTSVAALGITLATGVISRAILIGLWGFLFAFLLINLLALFICLTKSNCRCH
ncbi:MAG: hypothetical protein OSJ63_08090 [Bacilli bacterium]|nr:hypothetical protein [Bacilli bacterium]